MSQSKKPTDAEEFLTQAYSLEDKENMLKFYEKWAGDYDRQMEEGLDYVSPRLIAATLQNFLDNKNAAILDIGCGTGLTSKHLHLADFSHLHGIDISDGMIEVARSRNIYQSLKAADVNDPLEYEDNTFDAAISSGTFTHGHVGSEPLDEIFRILKPEGLLACTVHTELWESRGFKDKFSALEETGRIRCLSREMDRYFEGSEPEGWFCVYQKV